MSIQVVLPWPPTANTYWRRNNNRYFISSKGMLYRTEVSIVCHPYRNYFKPEDRLKLSVKAYPPDKRRRDLDNLFKSLQDSLQHAEVYKDDFQIDKLYIERMPIYDGFIIVDIEKII